MTGVTRQVLIELEGARVVSKVAKEVVPKGVLDMEMVVHVQVLKEVVLETPLLVIIDTDKISNNRGWCNLSLIQSK